MSGSVAVEVQQAFAIARAVRDREKADDAGPRLSSREVDVRLHPGKPAPFPRQWPKAAL